MPFIGKKINPISLGLGGDGRSNGYDIFMYNFEDIRPCIMVGKSRLLLEKTMDISDTINYRSF
jgi:hypothetical protein